MKRLLLAFNRGIISRLGLARIDLKRMAYSAEIQANIIPRVLGAAMLRPGWKYLATGDEDASGNSLPTITIPFIFSATEKALIEFIGRVQTANGDLRVYVDDELVSRPAVTAAVTNGFFVDDIDDWTDADEAGAVSTWTDSGNLFFDYMDLTGDGLNAAIRRQEVTVNETGVEHALGITVDSGLATLRVGSSAGAEDYIAEVMLRPGAHSLAFTPTGNFHIQLSNRLPYKARLSRCTVEAAGNMVLGTDFSDDDLPFIRYAQSGDIVFIACKGHQQRMVERRSPRSWSFTYYESQNGPWRVINVTDITLTPSALTGTSVITASKGIFREEHVGGLLRIASIGQDVRATITAEDTFTDPIRVVGIADARIFNVNISGTFTATLTVQYSVAEPGAWVDLATTYTAPTSAPIDDGLDNQIIYYRLGVKAGDFSSGTVTARLSIGAGSITGVGRIVEFNSATSVDVNVLKAFGGLSSSKDWWESVWSGYRGWPSAVGLNEGRLGWAGNDKILLSISDSYYEFDDDFEGDAGPISRSIGFGPIQDIFWLLPLQRLLMGTATNAKNTAPAVIDGNSPIVARSDSLDEPLTPTNFNLKTVSPIGLFVDRSGTRLMQLQFDGNDYVPVDMNLLTPDLNAIGISYIAVQTKPDIRIHCVRADGAVSMIVFDAAENVAAWVEVETNGEVEHCSVLPGDVEDQVYYVVKREIDGDTVRFIERWALESECQGGTLNKQADSFIEYSGSSTATITGLDHLEGETVVAWGSGKDLGEYTVASGSITLSEAVTSCIVGLHYRGRFKGAKLGAMFQDGINMRRKINELGLMLLNTHHKGVKYGPSFDKLYDLPQSLDSTPVAVDTVHEEFDFDMFSFGGDWSVDSRLHLEANAPKPFTIQAASLGADS
jgi:hypothetical protein